MKKYKFTTNPGLAELNSVYMKYRTVCREIGLREAAAVYAEQFVRNCVWAKYKSEEQALYLNEEQMSDINTAMCNSIYSGDARHALQAIQRCTRESMKQVLDDNPMHVSLIVFPLQDKTLALLDMSNQNLVNFEIPELTEYDDIVKDDDETRMRMEEWEEAFPRMEDWEKTLPAGKQPEDCGLALELLRNSDINRFALYAPIARELLKEKDIYTIAATACCRTMLFTRYANRQQERGNRRLEDALIFYKKIEEESKKDIQTLADIMYRSVNALTAGDFNGFYETGQNWSLCSADNRC